MAASAIVLQNDLRNMTASSRQQNRTLWNRRALAHTTFRGLLGKPKGYICVYLWYRPTGFAFCGRLFEQLGGQKVRHCHYTVRWPTPGCQRVSFPSHMTLWQHTGTLLQVWEQILLRVRISGISPRHEGTPIAPESCQEGRHKCYSVGWACVLLCLFGFGLNWTWPHSPACVFVSIILDVCSLSCAKAPTWISDGFVLNCWHTSTSAQMRSKGACTGTSLTSLWHCSICVWTTITYRSQMVLY